MFLCMWFGGIEVVLRLRNWHGNFVNILDFHITLHTKKKLNKAIKNISNIYDGEFYFIVGDIQ